MQRKILILFIASIGASAALGIFTVATGGSGGFTNQILGSLTLVAAASVLGLGSSIIDARKKWHPMGRIGIILAPLALVVTLIPIWGEVLFPGSGRGLTRPWWLSDFLWKIVGLAWVAAVAVPHIGLLSLAQLHRRFFWVRHLTIAFILLLAAAISIAIMEPNLFPYGAGIAQTIGILAILDGLGLLTIPALHRISAIKTPSRFVEAISLQIQMTCPRCALAQTLPVGRCACSQCGLRFVIEIEENVCEKCGYALYKLESSTCPECGTPILQNSVTASPSA